MARCFHIHDSGFQCVGETVDASDFCEAHQRVIPFVLPESRHWRSAIVRFVAFVLLVTLLIPLFYSLKSLYRGQPARAQEVW